MVGDVGDGGCAGPGAGGEVIQVCTGTTCAYNMCC
jgi:hypothetical protein